jgi:hypothetical protein
MFCLKMKLPAASSGASDVMPDLIRHPSHFWIPAFAGMTALTDIVAGVNNF